MNFVASSAASFDPVKCDTRSDTSCESRSSASASQNHHPVINCFGNDITPTDDESLSLNCFDDEIFYDTEVSKTFTEFVSDVKQYNLDDRVESAITDSVSVRMHLIGGNSELYMSL